jgi:hypothetical protein
MWSTCPCLECGKKGLNRGRCSQSKKGSEFRDWFNKDLKKELMPLWALVSSDVVGDKTWVGLGVP